MTRLTTAVTGNPLTFRPVTSALVRQSKDGDVNIVILFFGTHYNISMNGILQQDSSGDIDDNTKLISIVNHQLGLTLEQVAAGSTTANLVGTFSSFMFFYQGLKIKGNLKLPITSHAVTVPELEIHYHFKDLLGNDELIFSLILRENNLEFSVDEIVSGVTKNIYVEQLAAGVDSIDFEFEFLTNGKSKIFTIANYATIIQEKTRVWIGNLTAKLGECNVSVHGHNDQQTLRLLQSDYIFVEYPKIHLKFDREDTDRFVGAVIAFDDLNDPVEDNWRQIRSRDYKFEGNRIIENGMVRVVINTVDADIEIWGWNYIATIPSWEKVLTIIPDSDTDIGSLQIQNIKIEYFSKLQLKATINFGTSLYSFVMNRGDPYITVLNTDKMTFKISSPKTRMGGDFDVATGRGYTIQNTANGGSPRTVHASGTVTLVGALNNDTVTINGLVYTATTGVKSGNTQFSIDGTDTVDAADLVDSINNDTRVGITEPDQHLTSSNIAGVVTIFSLAGGVDGNLITFVSSNGTRLAVTGSGFLINGAATGGTGTETINAPVLADNYYAFYNEDADNETVGWFSDVHRPTLINADVAGDDIEYLFTYGIKGNIFGIGVLPSYPTNLVGKVPFPLVIGTQDEYVKWRGNEAVLSFRELETFKKR